MLSSIHPLGERAKGNHYARTATAHVLGATLGGALLGVALGLPAALLGRVLPAVVAALALAVVAAVAAYVEHRGTRIPSWHRQVNEDWLTEYRWWVYGTGFGLQLGLGVVTIITSAATYVAIAAAVLSGSFLGAVLVGTTFGLARGLTILTTARVQTPESLVTHARTLHRRAPAMSTLVQVTLATAAVLLVVTAVAA